MARPSPGPDMSRLAEQFVESMRDLGWKLDYSEESLQSVEDLIDRQFSDWRPWRRGKAAKKNTPIASLVGAYVGEVMIRHIGGKWGCLDGKADNLVFYYQAMKTA